MCWSRSEILLIIIKWKIISVCNSLYWLRMPLANLYFVSQNTRNKPFKLRFHKCIWNKNNKEMKEWRNLQNKMLYSISNLAVPKKCRPKSILLGVQYRKWGCLYLLMGIKSNLCNEICVKSSLISLHFNIKFPKNFITRH